MTISTETRVSRKTRLRKTARVIPFDDLLLGDTVQFRSGLSDAIREYTVYAIDFEDGVYALHLMRDGQPTMRYISADQVYKGISVVFGPSEW
ncbi:hypothetical protein CJ179_38715 [Rhodococcus sp. ACS1]|uniref:hypothetical protein n=1 Tax=Rhodococcus sp. ACS1 TaxID=2028570 RepID=UPI000BB1305B|nr:hypothetical protein [Rhodococcus sp. ACS1]PBC38534.1 hypothetical protein CJ179_38715 [Rhodococcus sp. ACS1]